VHQGEHVRHVPSFGGDLCSFETTTYEGPASQTAGIAGRCVGADEGTGGTDLGELPGLPRRRLGVDAGLSVPQGELLLQQSVLFNECLD
jgi:hypothetical protein